MSKLYKVFAKDEVEEEEDLKCLFKFSIDFLCVASLEGYFKRLNPSFEKLLGYGPNELMQKTFYDLIHEDDKNSTYNEVQKVANGNVFVCFENRYLCSDGTYIWISWNAISVDDKIYCTGRDVTLIKKTEKVLIEQQKKILLNSAKFSSLGEMALGIGHEIKNPVAIINLISIHLKRLAKGGQIDPNAIVKFANKIENASLRIDKIINGLKTLARNGDGDPLQDSNLQTIIDEMIDVAGEHLKKNVVKIKIIKLEEDPIVECHNSQIAQVILNLISNSCDAIKNLNERWIEIECKSDEDFYYISITDSGGGISPELHLKIFESFYTSKPIGEGTGLGLSISKKIIESHGGTLLIDDQSKFTKFVITLKRKDKIFLAA